MLRSILKKSFHNELTLEDFEFVAADGVTGIEETTDQPGETMLVELGIQDGSFLYLIPKQYWYHTAYRGRDIPKAEHRGITLIQLRDLAAMVIRKCVPEGWKSTNPELDSKRLSPENVTLYDLMEHYIRPLTREHKWSYVEHITVAEEDPMPDFFLSHFPRRQLSVFRERSERGKQED
ncbi:expressed unknown protein [Seminavis robusta]|uniref:Uncharacterized protein n=1 Tax=Seminavis robusta TaxID=568900 RepID=A0A9N8DU44_9STRA|nr:expressed unknown protein [Seminavis robusta]|eukprot:Sro292_g109680.1 n/a (178) ;mRNA; r:59339-59872